MSKDDFFDSFMLLLFKYYERVPKEDMRTQIERAWNIAFPSEDKK